MKKRSLFLVMLLFIAFVLVGCAKKRAMPNFDVPEEGYDGSKAGCCHVSGRVHLVLRGCKTAERAGDQGCFRLQ